MQDSKKVGFVSLGCPKALVDSENIITQLRAEGYDIAPDYQSADLVIVNTCGFIDDAVEESLETIGEAIAENGQVIVTGCLGAKGDVVQQTHPNVLAITGPHATEEVMNLVHQHLAPPLDQATILPPGGIKLTPRHYAYLKISEGCNHDCSFCIIPALRGKLESRSIDSVLDEAQSLIDAGVKELLIVSQDTSAYGVDLKYRTGFWKGQPIRTRFQELVEKLSELNAWIRLHYIYPYPHVDNIVPLMAEGKILPYLDIPLQHASPTILKTMKRPANTENMLQRIKHWRSICPDITLRSTFIVGFPGETDEDFAQLLNFIEQAQLDRVGAFTYSNVEGAQANDLPNAVPEEIKQQRLEQFMSLQAEISAQKLTQKIGSTQRVIIDAIEDDTAIARSYADAPEVDGLVYIENGGHLNVGSFADVEICDSDEYDLYAKLIS